MRTALVTRVRSLTFSQQHERLLAEVTQKTWVTCRPCLLLWLTINPCLSQADTGTVNHRPLRLAGLGLASFLPIFGTCGLSLSVNRLYFESTTGTPANSSSSPESAQVD